jgi:hypothetical protein
LRRSSRKIATAGSLQGGSKKLAPLWRRDNTGARGLSRSVSPFIAQMKFPACVPFAIQRGIFDPAVQEQTSNRSSPERQCMWPLPNMRHVGQISDCAIDHRSLLIDNDLRALENASALNFTAFFHILLHAPPTNGRACDLFFV